MLKWFDPNPIPVVDTHDGFYVVRDDLLGYGSKARFIDYLIKTTPHDEIVFGSAPRCGYGQISAAYVCQKYGKKFTLFLAKSKNKHPYTIKALEYGMNLIEVDMGFLAVTEKRARDYAAASETRLLLPIGLEHPTVLESIKIVAWNTPINPDHVWTASSSGTLHRGLGAAWPTAEVHAVSVGHAMDERQQGEAIVHKTPYKFSQEVKEKERPPFPCALNYEGKVWKIMKDYYQNHDKPEKVLFWNVGSQYE